MRRITESFTPAEEVTIENSLRYVEAIEQAVKREISRLPKGERSMMVGIIAGALAQSSEALARFRSDMERDGEATPVTEEQKLQLRMMMRLAAAKEKPEN